MVRSGGFDSTASASVRSQAVRYSYRVALLLVFHAAMPLAALAASVAEPESLTRFHDPVVVSAAALASFTMRATARFRLYAMRAGRLDPIPFQFDERDPSGDLVVTDDGVARPFSFDGNDELVFMAKDAGDRVGADVLPGAYVQAAEIAIIDPVDGRTAWAYLLSFGDVAPPRSSVAYASFDVAGNSVRASFYTIDYMPGRSSLMAGMRIAPAAGGADVNILSGTRILVRMTFGLAPFGTWRSELTEKDFGGEIVGFKNGPVRAVRRVRQRVDLGRFLPEIPGGTVDSLYYFSSFVTPSKFSIPWLALKALREMRYEGVSDFLLGDDEMHYWDGANPAGIRIDSHAVERLDTTSDHEWWAVSGPGGTCLHTFVIPSAWRNAGVARGTVLRIDDSDSEIEPSARFSVGYSLQDMHRLQRAGSYDLDVRMYVLPQPYEPGAEAGPLAASRFVLQTRVKDLGPPTAVR